MSDIIHSNPVLTNARGIPQAPTDIVDALRRIDDRLDLLHIRPAEYEYEGNPKARGTWAIIINWLENDPRRERIRIGELDPTAAFDYIVALPIDCPLDQARAFFERAVKGAAHMPEARTLLDRCSHWNEQQAQKNMQGARELGLEILDANKANPDMADSLGVGTVVTSAGGIEKQPPALPVVEVRKPNFVERMKEAKRRKEAQRAGAT
jgi:hypothetical protein